MAQKKQQPSFRTATLKKNKTPLKKGDIVFITEKYMGHKRWIYTAYKNKADKKGVVVTRSEFDYNDKEKFVVLVTRISYSSQNIEVDATDRKEAERLANEEAGNREFREHDAEYKIDSVCTKAEHETLFK